MNEPRIIDHDPDEPPPDRTGRWPYFTGSAAIAIVAGGYFLTRDPDWHSLAVGAGCGIVFTALIIEYTGNKVPKWMRR